MSGASKTKFAPDSAVKRGELMMTLGKLAEIDTADYNTSKFTDVKEDASYAPYVNWALTNNIISGVTATTFEPDKAITIQEMAVIMVNYAKTVGYMLPQPRVAVAFADNVKISPASANAVKTLQMAGVIMGKSKNNFCPTDIVTKAQVSAVLHRYVELVINKLTAQGFDVNDSG